MKERRVDGTLVHIHHVPPSAPVLTIEGEAYRWLDHGRVERRLEIGEPVGAGDTLALASGARVGLPGLTLEGGPRGCVHAFVPQGALAATPSAQDVPRILEQLDQILGAIAAGTHDPLSVGPVERTPVERAIASEMAHQNLDPEIARRLLPADARALRALPLFESGDNLFVAVERVSAAGLRALVGRLRRPVNPHLVDGHVLDALLDRIYPG